MEKLLDRMKQSIKDLRVGIVSYTQGWENSSLGDWQENVSQICRFAERTDKSKKLTDILGADQYSAKSMLFRSSWANGSQMINAHTI